MTSNEPHAPRENERQNPPIFFGELAWLTREHSFDDQQAAARDEKDITFVITLMLDSDLGMGLWTSSGQALRGDLFLLTVVLIDAGHTSVSQWSRGRIVDCSSQRHTSFWG